MQDEMIANLEFKAN